MKPRPPGEALDELAAMVAGGEVDPDRTAAFLDGEREVPTSMRLPARLLERAEELAPKLTEHPAFSVRASARVSRSAVLRVALERGLEALEGDLSRRAPRRAEVLAALELLTRVAAEMPASGEED